MFLLLANRTQTQMSMSHSLNEKYLGDLFDGILPPLNGIAVVIADSTAKSQK